MPPEETNATETPQTPAEAPAPVDETSAPAEPSQSSLETVQPEVTVPETTHEATSEPATAPSSVKTTEGTQEPAPTAQIPPSEPIRSEPVPITPAPIVVSHTVRELLAKAREMIQGRKVKKLEKILQVLSAKGKITNDEVEKLLHISDATATRYLSILEKQGKIKQVGKTGTGVAYTKV